MAIATALPGFSDLGRSVTPIFLLMDHSLHRLSMFSEKLKKIYLNLNFLANSVPFGCSLTFLSFLTQVTRYLTAVKINQKNYRLKNIRANVLKSLEILPRAFPIYKPDLCGNSHCKQISQKWKNFNILPGICQFIVEKKPTEHILPDLLPIKVAPKM